jgi:hypothetical protein
MKTCNIEMKQLKHLENTLATYVIDIATYATFR